MKKSPQQQLDKAKIMAETAQNLINMIQNRLNSRIDTLNAISDSPLDNLPDDVKKMRELEASKIRAVMEEQKDLIEIIKLLFPNA